MALRVKGHGMPAPTGGTSPGDLLVVIRTRHDPRFERRGADLWREESVSVADAVLGTNIRVLTLDGKEVSVKVPPGTQAGETLRLRGKGLPRFHDKAMGDMFIELSVVVPKGLLPQDRELFERLRDLTAKAHEEKKIQQKIEALYWTHHRYSSVRVRTVSLLEPTLEGCYRWQSRRYFWKSRHADFDFRSRG